MANHGLIVGLDVGTNTVKVLAADVRDQQANIVAVGRAVAHGVRKGVVVDIEATANDIRQVIAQVNEQTQTPVSEVVALIPAKEVQINVISGQVSVQDSQHIAYTDVQAVVKEALKGQVAADREVVDLVPNAFAVDDFEGVQDPNDMVGMRLKLTATAYTTPKNVLTNLRLAIEKAGLHLRDFVLAPLAASKTVLSDAEQEFGSILLDMGAGQTTATVVQNHQLRFISTFPAGGENISRDISTVLSIGDYDADMLKLDSGLALVKKANPANLLVIQPVGKEEAEQIAEPYLTEIIAARVDQILEKIGTQLQAVSAFDMPGGITLIGGTAALRGIDEAVSETYQVPTHQFAPDDIGLHHPGMAGAWAAVHYAALQTPVELIVKQALYGLPLHFIGQPLIAASAKRNPAKQQAALTKPVSKPVEVPEVAETTNDIINKPTHQQAKQGFSRIKRFFREFFD